MESKKHKTQDLFYKYIEKTLGIRFHRYLGYEGKKITFHNVEITPLPPSEKRMDILYDIDGEIYCNIENQSTPVYDDKMIDIYKYHILIEVESGMPAKSIVVSTANPNHGIEELDIPFGMHIKADFFYLKNKKVSKVLNELENKVRKKEKLTDTEAIDLVLMPDMDMDINISTEELFNKLCPMLRDANIPDEEFKRKLKKSEEKILQRFFKKNQIKEFEKMLHIKAEDVGLPPNITGFEEEMEMEYLLGKKEGIEEGKKEGINEIAKNLIELGIDETTISKSTELTHDEIQEIKKQIGN